MICGERDTVLYFYFGNGTMVSLFHFSTCKSEFYACHFIWHGCFQSTFHQYIITVRLDYNYVGQK